jgi:hypothetical protein
MFQSYNEKEPLMSDMPWDDTHLKNNLIVLSLLYQDKNPHGKTGDLPGVIPAGRYRHLCPGL